MASAIPADRFSPTRWRWVGRCSISTATGDRAWLTEAKNSGQFILEHFSDKEDLGYFTADPRTSDALKPYKPMNENIAAARFFNVLSNYSHEDRYKTAAIAALRSAGSNEAIRQYTFSPGLLLADDEMRNPPLHLTVVGPKDDASARALFKAILAVPPLYKQTEWLDPREGPLPGSDIEYPDQPRAAAYVCTKNLARPRFSRSKRCWTSCNYDEEILARELVIPNVSSEGRPREIPIAM